MIRYKLALLALTTALAAPLAQAQAGAGAAEPQPANEQVIVPEVPRREIKLPRFPSKDIAIGVFGGTYSTESFGASAIGGVRLGYHITEDIFVEGAYAQTKVSDESFRQILSGGIFTSPTQTLKYLSLSAGYNLLPGEVFIGSRHAKATAVYLIGGVGTTLFRTDPQFQERHQTFNFGLGLRLLLADRWALQVDLRDHIFSYDLLGERKSTQNLELTGGLTFYF